MGEKLKVLDIQVGKLMLSFIKNKKRKLSHIMYPEFSLNPVIYFLNLI